MKRFKRSISILLVLVLCLSLLPISSIATETESAEINQEEINELSEESLSPEHVEPGETVTLVEDDSVLVVDGQGEVAPTDTNTEAYEETAVELVPEEDSPSEDPMNETIVKESADEPAADASSSGQCGKYATWEVINQILQIEGVGAIYDWESDDLGKESGPGWCYRGDSYALPLFYTVSIEHGITRIGNNSFGLTRAKITSVSLPDTLTSIGYCSFKGQNSLSSITIPNSVTAIEAGAFYGCGLATIKFGTGLITIGQQAFEDCDMSTLELPSGLTTIGYAAFRNCTSLQNVSIPVSVTSIGSEAFWGCKSLETIQYAGTKAQWEVLTENYDTFPQIAKVICSDGTLTYEKCGDNLTWVLSNGLLTLNGTGAIYDYGYSKDAPWRSCSDMITSISIPEGVTSIGDEAFYDLAYVTSLTLPDSVTLAGIRAFAKMDRLESFTGGKNLTTIKNSALYYCISLKDVNLPSNLVTISASAFEGCCSITSVVFPHSITKLGATLFDGCSNLTTIIYRGTEAEWASVTKGSNAIPSTTTVQFRPSYQITFNANGGSGAPAAIEKVTGEAVTLPAESPTRDNYSFLGWSTSNTATQATYAPGSSITEDGITTLYAVWKPDTYTISYNANGGNGAPSSQTKTYGQTLTLTSSTPSRSGYLFLGWSVDSQAKTATYQPGSSFTLEKSTVLYAVWQKYLYVSYSANGGTGAPEKQQVLEGNSVTLSSTIPTRTSSTREYRFLGWSEDSAATSASYKAGDSFTPTASTTLYAVWEKSLLVSYYANSGSNAPKSQPVFKSENLTLSSDIPTREGYTFKGWSSNSSDTEPEYQPGDTVTPSADMVLYALWTPNAYTVRFDLNGGTGTVEPMTEKRDRYVTLPDAPVQESMAFLGWSCNSEAVEVQYAANSTYTILEDTTLYAVWESTLSFDANGGSDAPTTQTMILGAPITIPYTIPVREDYLFIGWSSSSSATEVEYVPGDSLTCNNCTVLYAVWEINGTRIGSSNVYWRIDDETLILFGKGSFDFNTSSAQAWASQQTTIKSVIIYNGITNIGDYAFCNCSGLISVVIPNSVTKIGKAAFCNCSGLTNLTIPNSVTIIGQYTFNNCSKLTSVTIPSSVTEIGDHAFDGCSRLTSVIIENGVESIGEGAFNNCSKLTSVAIPSSITKIGNSAFSGCSALTDFTIPSCVTTIESYVFSGCSALTSVTIPSSVTEIGNYAFNKCSKLTSVTIPKHVTTIGAHAFSNCSSLTSITIPGSVTSIESYTFYRCSNLTSVIIENGVTNIQKDSFVSCDRLTTLTIPDSVIFIGLFAFSSASNLSNIEVSSQNQNYSSWNGILFDKARKSLIYCPTGKTGTIDIPVGVSSIEDYAFSGCSGLTSVTIPNSVTSIGHSAFSGCSGLTGVTIPNSITTIETYTFYNCSGLTNVTIPNSVTTIGTYAFAGCCGLTSVIISESLVRIEDNIFSQCGKLGSITIPSNVTSIGQQAFYCSGLTNLVIPDSVTTIEKDAFTYCEKLSDVYYSGTEEQWNAISKNYNTSLRNATIHYQHQHQPAVGDVGKVISPSCTTSGYTEHTCIDGHSYRDNYITALGHSFGEVNYVWNDDHTKCIASRSCLRDNCMHTETIEAIVSYEVTTEPKCEISGKKTYTATFSETWAETQSYEEEILPLEHEYKVSYEWNNEHTECVATKACIHEGCDIQETDTAISVTNEVTTLPKCEVDGVRTYTATFTQEWAETQTYEEAVTALEHIYGPTSYNWNEDHSKCTASHTCTRDGCEHTETIKASVTNMVTTKPRCEVSGVKTYKATFTKTWAETQSYEEEILPLEHEYQVSYEWNDTHTECVATKACVHEGCESQETDTAVSVTNEITTQPKCEVDGVRTYTATFTQEWAKTGAYEEAVPALEHNWGAETSYHWNEDHSECTATRPCTREDCTSQDTAKATVTSQETTIEGTSAIIYTASFSVLWAQQQEIIVGVPGDINGDGKVMLSDIVRLLRYLTNQDVEMAYNGDVNGDKSVTVLDVIHLVRYILGLDVSVY